jgi:hypothetical protein
VDIAFAEKFRESDTHLPFPRSERNLDPFRRGQVDQLSSGTAAYFGKAEISESILCEVRTVPAVGFSDIYLLPVVGKDM